MTGGLHATVGLSTLKESVHNNGMSGEHDVKQRLCGRLLHLNSNTSSLTEDGYVPRQSVFTATGALIDDNWGLLMSSSDIMASTKKVSNNEFILSMHDKYVFFNFYSVKKEELMNGVPCLLQCNGL